MTTVAAAAEISPSSALLTIPDDALILLPVLGSVLFPATMIPLHIARADLQLGVQEAVRLERPVGAVLQRQSDQAESGAASVVHWDASHLHDVGTSAAVLRYLTAPDGTHRAVLRGMQRFRILGYLDGYPFPVARVQFADDSANHPEVVTAEVEGRARALKQSAHETLQLLPQAPPEMAASLDAISDPAQLADVITGLLDIAPEDKQALLETFDLKTHLDSLLALLARRIAVLKVARDVAERTNASIGDVNRKHMLREQIRVIQNELGEGVDSAVEIEEFTKAIADAHMPADVEKAAQKELKRLARMPDSSGEGSAVRTYLDWLTELPWAAQPEPVIDMAQARRVLDEDHFGLEKVKKRILEYLAVRKLNPAGKSPILCFVGPPGVGKTSLGQSIAKATGRGFVRVSLGGVHDEAEIRGHRRTYVGALPGNIIQGLRKTGTRSGVMMLDEVDKLGGGGFQGDPASALLEVLDPEQNASFRDTYLAVPFDLSMVMFLCTANVLDTIPGPLRDRMEIIQLPGYTTHEKLQISRRYLVARQLSANGLDGERCGISDAALTAIIEDYTREAGVRHLEREIGSVFRSVAVRVAEGTVQGSLPRVQIEVADLAAILGRKKYEAEVAMGSDMPGVATGLAWTPVGGDILFIEASLAPGNGRLILTGQLGEVMKESAQAALSLVKARAEKLGISAQTFEKSDIHIHVPAGATPKDGPSAGVAMFVALTSLLTGRPVRSHVAMTGEISLRGLVLPIGGVKEKVLAALRAGITTVMLPARNERDLDDIPAEARAQLKFIWLKQVDGALEFALKDHKVDAPVVPEALKHETT
jgi:ATP-dependent Lon protease